MKPEKNSLGEDAVYLTHYQKYTLDTRGWLAIHNVLEEDLVKDLKDHCIKHIESADSASMYDQPVLYLSEHPVVMGILNEMVSYQATASDHSYGYRLESSFCMHRIKGNQGLGAHGGGGFYASPQNSHYYSCRPAEHLNQWVDDDNDVSGYPGHLHTGLTRIAFELNPVEYGNGTRFVPGSHKAALPKPAILQDLDSELWESYECESGALILFTEATCHAGAEWTSDWPRYGVFNCYNSTGQKFHRGGPSKEQLATMTPLQQSLFRGVWGHDFTEGKPNTEFDPETNFAF